MDEQALAEDRLLVETCQERCRSEFMGDATWGGIPDDQRGAFKRCADQCIGSGRDRADKAAKEKRPRLFGRGKRKG